MRVRTIIGVVLAALQAPQLRNDQLQVGQPDVPNFVHGDIASDLVTFRKTRAA